MFIFYFGQYGAIGQFCPWSFRFQVLVDCVATVVESFRTNSGDFKVVKFVSLLIYGLNRLVC